MPLDKRIKALKTSGIPNPYIWLIILAWLTYGRVWSIRDVIWDDNAWLLSVYATENLSEFLEIGFNDLRRESLGVFLYFFFGLHRYTDLFFPAWHGLWLLLSALSPIALYALVNELFKDRYLAFFSGLALIIFPLDYTIGFASAVNYPIALFLMLLSLLFSVYMFRRPTHRFRYMTGALLTAGVSQYIFLEASIALEPARLLAFAYLTGGNHWHKNKHRKVALKTSAPFLLLPIPLVIYKLTIPTSGIHSALYQLDILNLFDLKQYAISIAHFFFFPWVVLGLNLDSLRSGTVIIAVMAAILVALFLRRILSPYPAHKRTETRPRVNTSPAWTKSKIIIFALTAIIPVFLLFQLAGRPIAWGIDSSHAALCQIGYALIAGLLLRYLWSQYTATASRQPAQAWAIPSLIAMLIGLGVFFSNLNIDLYYRSWEAQSRFHREILHRFPHWPNNAVLVTDVRDDNLYSDIRYYDIEFSLNLLYASSPSAREFYRLKILTAQDFRQFAAAPREAQRSGKVKIMRATDYGIESINIDNLIFIHYWNGQLLVNQEINEKIPNINYRSWLDRSVTVPDSASYHYPLRAKLKNNPSLSP